MSSRDSPPGGGTSSGHGVGEQMEKSLEGRKKRTTASPDMDLFISPLLPCIILVQSSQLSIISLVQSLIFNNLQVFLSNLLEDNGQGVVSTLENGSVGDIEVIISLGLESDSSSESFGSSLFGESGVLGNKKHEWSIIIKCVGERTFHPVKRLSLFLKVVG